jgi:uncharacterized membrane protein (DUF2068 family)
MATAHEHGALRIIAIYKLVKVLGLLTVAIAAFNLVPSARVEAFAAWIEQLPIHHGQRYVAGFIERLLELGPRKFLALGIAACVYASVFAVEGWGLWRGKRWAEYLTAVVTASLIPLEVWEIFRHLTWLKIAAFVANVGIVWYLIYLLRRER